MTSKGLINKFLLLPYSRLFELFLAPLHKDYCLNTKLTQNLRIDFFDLWIFDLVFSDQRGGLTLQVDSVFYRA